MKRFNFDQCGKNFAIGCNLNDHEIDSYNWIVNISFFGFGLISYFFTIVFFWKCFMSYFTVVFYVQFCLGVFYSRCFLSRYFFSMCFIVDTPGNVKSIYKKSFVIKRMEETKNDVQMAKNKEKCKWRHFSSYIWMCKKVFNE